jgi:phospholipid/cholesterol/gamma-HCH transport system substrate-binding protein
VVVLLLAVAIGAVIWRHHDPGRRLVAHFTQTVGIHPGSEVRVLGVKIGDVVAVRPEGRSVRVELRYSAKYRVPADAQAVVVPPSIVSDRYIQLAPAYAGGPALADGADIPLSRTAVPLELDDIYRSLDELNRALGPSGANAGGALSNLVGTARKNLDGNGDQLHDTLAGLSDALSTVADRRDDLFKTIANLQDFTTALARSDAQVRAFNQQLATVAEQLAAEREDIAAALRSLATALADITGFVRENRTALSSNVAALADVTGVLVRQQRALIDVLDVAPLALSNLNLSYNPRSGTLDTRDNALGPYDPASYVCSLIVNVVPIAQVPKACVDLARTLVARKLPLTNELRRLVGLPPVPSIPGGIPSAAAGAAPGAPSPPGLSGGPDQSSRDLTMGGILRGGS